jgi:iron transport multicopper oxidase
MQFISSLVLLTFFIHQLHAARVVYDYNITYVDNVNPDNLYSRQVVGINGQWP